MIQLFSPSFSKLAQISYISKVVNLVTVIVIVASQEHSDELKSLALEDAVKSTIGQKKQLEVHKPPKNDALRRVIEEGKSGGMRLMMTSTMLMPSLGALNPRDFYDFCTPRNSMQHVNRMR